MGLIPPPVSASQGVSSWGRRQEGNTVGIPGQHFLPGLTAYLWKNGRFFTFFFGPLMRPLAFL